MASSAPNIDKQILDIEECVKGLKQEFIDNGLPITDDNTTFHRLCAKLEYLLQAEQKEKFTLLGSRKGYWDYFCKCLATKRNVHDGLKFVKSISEFRTSPGRGRAFIRFCLVNQCLADSLQQCFQNGQVTSDFYRERSPLMHFAQTSYLVAALYELNEVPFDLSPQGTNLDMGWPTFSHKVFGGATSAWNPPSRTLSMTSLFSLSSQPQDMQQSFGRSFSDEQNLSDSRPNSDIESAIHGIVAKIEELNANQCETNELTKELALNASRQLTNPRGDGPVPTAGTEVIDALYWENREADLRSRLAGMERAADEHARQLEAVSARQDDREQSFRDREREMTSQVAALERRNEELAELVRGLEEQSGRVDETAVSGVTAAASLQEQKEGEEGHVAVARPMDEGREAKYKKAVAVLMEKLACKERVNGHLERQVSALKEVAAAVKDMMQVRTNEVLSLRKIVDELKSSHTSGAPTPTDVDARVLALEQEKVMLEEQARELRQNVENVRRDFDDVTEQLRQRDAQLEATRSLLEQLEAKAAEGVRVATEVAQQLDASEAERSALNGRLQVLEGLLRRVEVAEEELERREEEEAMRVCRDSRSGDEAAELPTDDTEDDGSHTSETTSSGDARRRGRHLSGDVPGESDDEGGRPRPLGSDGRSSSESRDTVVQLALVPHNFPVAQRALARLQGLLNDKRGSHACSTHHQVGSKLVRVTSELRATKSLVDQLKSAHKRLQTSDAILRYELREKRVFVERMKQQLESASNMRLRVRQKHSESELEWQSLRAEFASRRQQDSSEESGMASAAELPSTSTESTSEATSEVAATVVAATCTSPRDKSEERESVDGASCSSDISSSSAANYSSASPDLPAAGVDATTDAAAVSSETEEDERSPTERRRRTDVRLELMEEQCRLLYCSLLSSMKKSERLHWKLSKLHDSHSGQGPRSEGAATPPPAHSEEAEAVMTITATPQVICQTAAQSTPPVSTHTEVLECIDEPVDEPVDGALSLDEVDALDTDRDAEALQMIDEVVIDDGKLVAKLDTLLVAQSLAKRVEVLKRKKQGLEGDVARMVTDREEGRTREVQLRQQLEEAGAVVVRLESMVKHLQAERTAQLEDMSLQQTAAERRAADSLLVLETRLNDERSSLEQEATALRFQMSTAALLHETIAQRHSCCEGEMVEVRQQLAESESQIEELEQRLDGLAEERTRQRAGDESVIRDLQIRALSAEEECALMCEQLRNTTRQLDESRGAHERLTASLDESRRERERLRDETEELRTLTDDMREKIIQLTRDKDTLWRRGERLSFIQQVQSADRWHHDQEVSHCMNCNAEFSIVLRKHHCRICGRIFCFGCCNHWASTAAHSGRVRVCDECVVGHAHVDQLSTSQQQEDEDESDGDQDVLLAGRAAGLQIQRDTDACLSTALDGSEDISPDHSSILQASTYSETSSSAEGDRSSEPREGGSLLGRLLASWSQPAGASKAQSTTPGESDDEFHVIGDEEILKSLSHSSPYTNRAVGEGEAEAVHLCPLKDVLEIDAEFADGIPREVWINAGKVYGVPVTVASRLTLRWEFSTEPKSIAFSLVYHAVDAHDVTAAATAHSVAARLTSSPTRVLVPLTHCDSHLRTVHGKLTVRNSGIYTFYFGNDFSRFTAKKLKFIARIEKSDVPTVGQDNENSSLSSSSERESTNEISG